LAGSHKVARTLRVRARHVERAGYFPAACMREGTEGTRWSGRLHPAARGAYDDGMFATTRWSLVAAARDRSLPEARHALAELCRAYWYPVYAYVRWRGHDHDGAQDLTQEFFARLLETDGLAGVDPDKGRFRSYLLAACQHFLANQHDHAHAQKRGGDRTFVPLDSAAAQGRWDREPTHAETPERLFERRWALALLEQVLGRLRAEYELAGRGRLFDHLKGRLTGDRATDYATVAADLGLSGGAVKVAVHRLRKRYGELLRDEIAQTVGDPALVEDEIRALFAALGSGKSASGL
jgi:RNA polymerase sigma factor (sigma-70 family)